MAREQEWQWTSDLFFSPAAVGEVPFLMVELKPEAERPKNWCILTEDNADGQALGEGVKAVAAEHGVNVALYQTYTPGTKDYSSIILKMKENDIDAIVVLISAGRRYHLHQADEGTELRPQVHDGMERLLAERVHAGPGS